MTDSAERRHQELLGRPDGQETAEWLRALAVAVTGLGAASLVAALVRCGGGAHILLEDGLFLAWGLVPFAVAFLGLRRRPIGVARPVGVAGSSGFGLVMYANLVFASRLSSTAALAFIFIPLWQLLGCGTVLLLTVRRRRTEGAA